MDTPVLRQELGINGDGDPWPQCTFARRVEEITSGENVVSEDGWARLSAIGVEGIKEVLNELAQSEEVVWVRVLTSVLVRE